jgi:hypothetical protein
VYVYLFSCGKVHPHLKYMSTEYHITHYACRNTPVPTGMFSVRRCINEYSISFTLRCVLEVAKHIFNSRKVIFPGKCVFPSGLYEQCSLMEMHQTPPEVLLPYASPWRVFLYPNELRSTYSVRYIPT